MVVRVDTNPSKGGREIVRLVTSDACIVVPEEVDGAPVVSLGSMFLRDSHGSGSRSLTVPASVVRASPDALSSASSITSIKYLGDFATFSTFGWNACADCKVECADGFSFMFPVGSHMGFPRFDDEYLASNQRMSEAIVMARIRDPLGLTEANRERYVAFMKNRICPMAKHAISENDLNSLKPVLDTGLLSEADMRLLLKESVRSGRTSSTSLIMSALNKAYGGRRRTSRPR